VRSFTTPQTTTTRTSILSNIRTSQQQQQQHVLQLNMAPKDPSRSGSKQDRLNKLADREELGSANAGDNSVFVKAAGGFVAFIVIAIAAAASSGLLTQY